MNSLTQHLVSEVTVFLNLEDPISASGGPDTAAAAMTPTLNNANAFVTLHITDNKFSCFYMVIEMNTVREQGHQRAEVANLCTKVNRAPGKAFMGKAGKNIVGVDN